MRQRNTTTGLTIALALAMAACSSGGSSSSSQATVPPGLNGTTAVSSAPSTDPITTTTVAAAPAVAVAATCPDGAASSLSCFTVAVPVDPAAGATPAVNLAVTVRRADSSVWTAPVLSILGTAPGYPWTDPNASSVFTGHDMIWIDQRGAGRSDGVTNCPDVANFPGDVHTDNLSPAAIAAFAACFAKVQTSVVPFASMFDHALVAADFEIVRRALGIEKWALYAGSAGADIALHLVDINPSSVTALVSRTPTAVGAGGSMNDLAAAFGRFADDCAAAPKCSAKGDLKQALAAVYQRDANPVTTKTVDPGSGRPIVLDRHSLIDSMHAIGSTALAPLVPDLLPGGVDGSSDEQVAQAFVSNPIDALAWAYVAHCQNLDYTYPGLVTTANDQAGIFADYTPKRFCDAVGPLPQYSPRAKPTSAIPVLAVLPSYDPRSSVTTLKGLFSGFANTTIVEVPRIVDPIAQLRDCFFATANAFLAAPTAALDTSCLTSPAVATLS